MLLRKGLTFGIILLLIVVSIIPSTGIKVIKQSTVSTLDGNTLYVGGNGPGNYTSIQKAIESASEKDTIFVFNGIYYETITISKTLNIQGESKNSTIINGQYKEDTDILFISADHVTINNFTIQCSKLVGKGIEINDCNHITISNCNFNNHTSDAIRCVRSKNNLILNCKVENSNIGIRLNENCDNNTISNCQIVTDRTAIGISSSNNYITNCILNEQLRISWGSNNSIINCIFSNDDIGRHAIQMAYTTNNTLRDNSFDHCGLIFHCNYPQQLNHNIDSSNMIDERPIYYLIGKKDYTINESMNIGYIGLISCQNITVKNQTLHGGIIGDSNHCAIDKCSFIENTHGIAIDLSSNNIISHCNFSNAYPIRIFKSSNNTINNCSMLLGHPYGFGMEIDYYSYDNSIINCQIAHFWDGIVSTGYSSRNTIIDCNIQSNSGGISLSGNDNMIEKCNVYNNGLGLSLSGNDNMIEKCNVYNNGLGLSVEGNNNWIIENNFFNNTNNANAFGSNTWNEGRKGNYWDDWIGHRFKFFGFLPYRVPGTLFSNFDWHPARKPYDI